MTASRPGPDEAVQSDLVHVLDSFISAEQGRAIAVHSLRGGSIEFARNGDRPQPGASLLKLGIALAILRQSADGVVDLSADIPLNSFPSTIYPTILRIFDPGRSLSVGETVQLMLATSDNPPAEALVRRVGRDSINAFLGQLGCAHTTLNVGFSDEYLGTPGRANLTSAQDMITLLKYAYSSPLATRAIVAMTNGVRKTRIPLRLPDELPVANKTGSLEGVVNDAAILFGAHHHLAVAVLCDSQQDTARTAIEIGDAVREMWRLLGEKVD